MGRLDALADENNNENNNKAVWHGIKKYASKTMNIEK